MDTKTLKEQLMNMQAGTKLVCVANGLNSKDLSVDSEYTFNKYKASSVPVNNYSATMSWYPNKPIWSDEEYEDIRFNFMQIEIDGIEHSHPLKYFKIKE